MKKKNKSVIELKEERLRILQSQSSRALDVVTSTINSLSETNELIDKEIKEIKEAKDRLSETENNLDSTRLHNTKVIDKFKALIEV